MTEFYRWLELEFWWDSLDDSLWMEAHARDWEQKNYYAMIARFSRIRFEKLWYREAPILFLIEF